MPHTSMRAGCAVKSRRMNRTMNAKARMPRGRVRKNRERQPKLSVTVPPTRGPATELTANTVPIRPWYLPRCRGGMMSPMMV